MCCRCPQNVDEQIYIDVDSWHTKSGLVFKKLFRIRQIKNYFTMDMS